MVSTDIQVCNVVVFIKNFNSIKKILLLFHDNFKTFSCFLLEISNFLFPLRFSYNFDYDSKRNSVWFQKMVRGLLNTALPNEFSST